MSLPAKRRQSALEHIKLYFSSPSEIFDLALAGREEKDRAARADGSTFEQQNFLSALQQTLDAAVPQNR